MQNKNLIADLVGRNRFADVIIDHLVRQGVTHIFGMPAESVNCLVDAMSRRPDIRFVSTRHETAASFMAAGYARATGKLGVCFGTAGPGATHLLPGVYDAHADRHPVLAISGQVPVAALGTGSFQEIDSARLFRDGCARSVEILSTDHVGVFDQLCWSALHERTSVHVAIPGDVLSAPVPDRVSAPRLLDVGASVSPDKDTIAALAESLHDRPVAVVLGAHAGGYDMRARALAHLLGVPLHVLPEACAAPLTGPPTADSADLPDAAALLVGLATPGLFRAFPRLAGLVQIADIEETRQWGVPPTRIVGDIETTLDNLIAELTRLRDTATAYEQIEASEPAVGWIRVLRSRLDDGQVVVDGARWQSLAAGQLSHCAAVHSSWNLRFPGAAVPTAIGMALATGRRIHVLTEKSHVDQYVSELSTAVRYEVPITVVCVSDDLRRDRTLFARAFGVDTRSAATEDELDEALAVSGGGPRIVLMASMLIGEPAGPVGGSDLPRLVEGLGRFGFQRIHMTGFCAAEAPGLDVGVAVDGQAAALRASVDDKAFGTRAAVVVTSPAALLMQMNGLYDAAYDHAALLVVTVEDGRWLVDSTHLLAEVSRWSCSIEDPARDGPRLQQALAAARHTRGVVHVRILRDALPELPLTVPPGLTRAHLERRPSAHSVARAVDLLRHADRPTIIAGRGAAGTASELRELARLVNAPVFTTMGGSSVRAGIHGARTGLVGSSGHHRTVREIQRSDVVVLVGVSSRGAAFDLVSRASVVSINTDPMCLIGLPEGAAGLLGDARTALQAMIGGLRAVGTPKALADNASRPFTEPIRHAPALRWRRWGPLRPSYLARIMNDEIGAVPDRITVSVDVGLNTLWAFRYLRTADRYLWTSSFATMGFAIPAALEVAAAGEAAVAVVGDGGAAITLAELASGAAIETPVVVVVFDNGALGAIRYESYVMGWPDSGSTLSACDFAAYARGCGLAGRTVTTHAEFRREFSAALRRAGVTVIDAKCTLADAPVLAGWPPAGQLVGLAAAWVRGGKSDVRDAPAVIRSGVQDRVGGLLHGLAAEFRERSTGDERS
ncbi:thiamine pyrophosphate-binding protein [Nocardia transvalensis]|uniref:thiamine pyrophosphate-binding protein n=1 Tax=Nocardia transvalensis TaxID=37333 RepID=UPI001895EE7B|nr:thiamine pyrophosphate-binding protein [Nocardia transvalensis]MBF6333042.1 thiamine pyrophosphate-binding protein [Nocardia transvalensis]